MNMHMWHLRKLNLLNYTNLKRLGWLILDIILLCLFPRRHQLQCPGQYSPLEAFYEDKKAVLPPAGNGLVTACPTWSVTTINRCMHPEMKVNVVGYCRFAQSENNNNNNKKITTYLSLFRSLQITHPAGCMSQFIQFFGEQIMVLWKFALLRKRILIFSPPPVGVVCYRGEKLIYLAVVAQILSLFFFHTNRSGCD